MGMILTLPISSAALGVILNLSGLAAGAATVGCCCCNMVGFAVASYVKIKSEDFGTGNRNPMPQVEYCEEAGDLAGDYTGILGPGEQWYLMTNNATGSGMGTAGLVGQIM